MDVGIVAQQGTAPVGAGPWRWVAPVIGDPRQRWPADRVRFWRFVPADWWEQLGADLLIPWGAACNLAVFGNEPDIEGPGGDLQRRWEDRWVRAGGRLLAPAWSDATKQPIPDGRYAAVSAHCYAGDWRNLELVRTSSGGRPVYVTEYGRPHAQSRCLLDIAAGPAVIEPVALFAWEWAGHAGDGYDLNGVVLTPPPTGTNVPQRRAPVVPVELTEGNNSNLCGQIAVAEWFDGAGHQVSPIDLYRETHGVDYLPPGDLTSFSEIQRCVQQAAAMTGAKIELYKGDGYVWDLNTFDQLVRDGWCVIAGTWESDIHPGENYGHFFAVYGLDGDKFRVKDELHAGDTEIAVTVLHQAMVDNWTGPNGQDAFAWKFV